MKARTRRSLTGWKAQAIVLALLLLGAALRLPQIGRTPPGLYHDEAQHGIDALAVLDGDIPLYFEANNGREPLYIYLVSAAVAILGRTPMAIRLPACFVGILTLAATYDLTRTLWDCRTARWALAVLSVTFWHIHLSRVGFRAVLLPLFTALALSQAAKGVRRDHPRHWIAAGVLYGASWYSYMAARFTPVAIVAVAAYALLLHRNRARDHLRGQPTWRVGAVLACAAALVVLLPLGITTLLHPEVVLARTGQVSVFSASINQGYLWRALGEHALRTLGMFTLRGDRIWRHNLAWRPVWEPALALAFLYGLGVSLARLRRDAGAAVTVIWMAVMALPTLLAEDAPHFLRGVGVLPTAALLPALGLSRLGDRLRHWGRSRATVPAIAALASTVPLLLWGIGLCSTVYDYFVRFQAAPLTYHWFEGGPVELAGQINAFRGAGWDGSRMGTAARDDTSVYIDSKLWESWTALPYLVPETATRPLPVQTEPAARSLFVVWPYREWEPDVLPHIARPAYLQVTRGPNAQGDLDPEPFSIATLIQAEPRPEVPAPIGRFEAGVVLRAALVRPLASGARVLLWWETEAPIADAYTVFVHYERNGARIAQHDGAPGYGHLGTAAWQVGDLVLDEHPLPDVAPEPTRDTLRVGLYNPATGNGLALLNADGTFHADAATLPVVLAGP